MKKIFDLNPLWVCLLLSVGNPSIQASSLFKTLATGLTLFAVSGHRDGPDASMRGRDSRILLDDEQNLFIQSFGSGYDDYGNAIEVTSDGSLLIAGATEGTNAGSVYDGLALKQNPDGTIAYAKAFGNSADTDYLYGITETLDGGIALMGREESSEYSIGSRVLAVKLNSNWDLQWAKSILYGTVRSYIYTGTSTNDGGIVMGGRYYYNPNIDHGLLLKLDVNGNRVWSKYFWMSSSDVYVRSIVETTIGNLAFAGYYDSTAFSGLLNSAGGIAWVKRMYTHEYAYGIAELSDGSFGVAGNTLHNGAGGSDAMVARLDSSGNLLWIIAVGGTDEDYGYAITATSDGGMVIGGKSDSFDSAFGTREAGFIFKLDQDANLVWAKVIGGGDDDVIEGVKERSNGQLVFTGNSEGLSAGEGDALIIRLSADGRVLEGCSAIATVFPTVTNISSSVTFDWVSGYTYAEVSPSSVQDWNVTITDVTSFNQYSACEATQSPTPPTTTASPTSILPTMAPTLRPIFYPTEVTVDPTDQPTKDPTTTPTEYPTSNPSLATAVPSVSPTRNMDPVIENPISTQYGTIDDIFEFYIPTNTFSDPDGDTLTLSVSLVNNDPLPSWINYVVASKKFIGTPTLNDEGTILIKITATDPQNASVSDIFGIVISEKETDRPTADPTGVTLSPSYHPSTSPLATPTTTSGIETTTATPTKQPEQDSSSQGISSGSSTKDPMFILVMCLGTGLFCFCGSVVFYCCFVNKKLEYSLQTMNKSVEEGKNMKSATQNVQNELQTIKTKEDTL